MDQNKASQHRRVVYKTHPNLILEAKGDKVHSVSQLGVVLAIDAIRLLLPWHNVIEFTYHTQVVAARKVIQGY